MSTKKILYILSLLLSSALPLFAGHEAPSKDNSLEAFLSNPLLLILALIALILLFAIYVLGKVALMVINKTMEERKRNGGVKPITKTILALLGLFSSITAWGQADGMTADASTSSVISTVVSKEALYASMSVIIAEIIIIAFLYFVIRKFTKGLDVAIEKRVTVWDKIWAKLDKSTPVENEGDIDLGHDYDGIRELDNPTPPWWRWAFYLSILFGVVYVYRYHVAKSAPMQYEELAIEIEKGEADKKAYLATSTDAFDETTLEPLEGDDIAQGAAIYAKNCVACHGAAGEGNAVGPNLTDAYWIHEGGVRNIFKSIKYGWPEKGMKSWQDDFSSYQLAQVASYVHSIQGSNPPNAKEPQGELYKEEAVKEENAPADSTKPADAAATPKA